MCISKCRMKPAVREVLPGAVGWSGIDLLVGVDDGLAALGFADTIPEVGNEFLERPNLGLGGPVTIEITDEADSERNVIQVVAGDVASVELCRPAVTDLHLAVSRTMSVANNEMVSQTVLHVTNTEVVDVKDPRISLTGAAVVDNDIFPAAPSHRGSIDGCPRGGTEIIVGFARTKNPAPESFLFLR